MANQLAIAGAIKLLVDSGKAIAAELKPGQSLSERIDDFKAVVPDALAELGMISDLPAEFKSLQVSDIPALAGLLISDLALEDKHASSIVNAALPVLTDLASKVEPDVEALLKAIAG